MKSGSDWRGRYTGHYVCLSPPIDCRITQSSGSIKTRVMRGSFCETVQRLVSPHDSHLPPPEPSPKHCCIDSGCPLLALSIICGGAALWHSVYKNQQAAEDASCWACGLTWHCICLKDDIKATTFMLGFKPVYRDPTFKNAIVTLTCFLLFLRQIKHFWVSTHIQQWCLQLPLVLIV